MEFYLGEHAFFSKLISFFLFNFDNMRSFHLKLKKKFGQFMTHFRAFGFEFNCMRVFLLSISWKFVAGELENFLEKCTHCSINL